MKTVAALAGHAAAVVLVVLTGYLAIDFAGVLWWSHWLAASAVCMAAIAGAVSVLEPNHPARAGYWPMAIGPALLVVAAWCQTAGWSDSTLRTLSPGSAAAFEGTAENLRIEPPEEFAAAIKDSAGEEADASERLTMKPTVSVSPTDTSHAAALGMAALAAWVVASVICHSRDRVGILVSGLAIGPAVVALLGFAMIAIPSFNPLGHEVPRAAFGGFINRNNAALFLNIGCAGSLGLLAWRLSALTGTEIDGSSFEFSDLFTLASDRYAMLGVAALGLNASALLVCGSRGGLVSAVVASALAFGWGHRRRGRGLIALVVVIVATAAAILTVPLDFDFTTLDRFSGESRSLLNDGRLPHWRDAAGAAAAYFPMGSGLSTYAYAFLPFREVSPGGWYQHADNLWIELIVEMGLVGVVAWLMTLVTVVAALNRLGHSHEPWDHSLRVGGWYAVGVVVVSQAFDFGLAMSANLFAVAILFGGVACRAAMVVTESEEAAVAIDRGRTDGKRLRFRSAGSLAIPAALAVSAFAMSIVAERRLSRDAAVAGAHATAGWTFAVRGGETDDLRSLLTLFGTVDPEGENPDLAIDAVRANVRLGRLAELRRSGGRTPLELRAIFQTTSPANRRLDWTEPTPRRLPSEAAEDYAAASRLIRASLAKRPLQFDARRWIVFLDFFHGDVGAARTATHELVDYAGINVPYVRRLVRLADRSNDSAFAIDLSRRIVNRHPSQTEIVLRDHDTQPERWDSIISDDPKSAETAASRVIKWTRRSADPAAVRLAGRLADDMTCDDHNSLTAKVRCVLNRVELNRLSGRPDAAIEDLRRCTRWRPTEVDLWVRLIRLLLSESRAGEAAAAYRTALGSVSDAAKLKALEPRIADALRDEENSRGGRENIAS